MIVHFLAFPARKTDYGYQVQMTMGTRDHLPGRTEDVANLKDLLAKFAVFKAECEATSLPLKVFFSQSARDHSRKFPGFNKARHENYFTTAAETATEADLYKVGKGS